MTPSSFEHVSRPTSRRQVIKGLAATVAAGALGFGASQAAFANELWQKPAYGTLINQLVVRIVTGTDDLRQASQAVAYILLDNGKFLDNGKPRQQTIRLGGFTSAPGVVSGGLNYNYQTNTWDGWSASSFNDPRFFIWDYDTTIFPELQGKNGFPVNYIRWFKIHFESGQPDILSTPDNWNLNAIRVLYPKNLTLSPTPSVNIDWSQYYELFYAAGPDGSSATSSRPLKRFMSSDDWTTINPFTIYPQ